LHTTLKNADSRGSVTRSEKGSRRIAINILRPFAEPFERKGDGRWEAVFYLRRESLSKAGERRRKRELLW
jgi:hypothetical protein